MTSFIEEHIYINECKDTNMSEDPLLLAVDLDVKPESPNNVEAESNSDSQVKREQKKYVELSTTKKLEVIKYLDNHSQRSAAKYFGISKTTVNNIKKKETHYQKLNLEHNNILRKPMKPTIKINKATLMWLKRVNGSGQRITGVKLQSVALKFADRYKIDFKASTGWLNSFKQRNKINFNRGNQKLKPLFEEPESPVAQDDFVEVMLVDDNDTNMFSEISSKYRDEDVFCVSGCILMYKAFPNTLQSENSNTEQFTVLLAASVKGEKLQPLVIGKENELPPPNTPIIWRTNPTFLLTREIFTEWLFTLDAKMNKENRRIVIIIPNLSVYNFNCNNLKNIKLQIVVQECQPLTKAITQTFKTFYRKIMLEAILEKKSNSPLLDVLAAITHLDGIYWIIAAWNQVNRLVIENNFCVVRYPVKKISENNLQMEETIEMPILPDDMNLDVAKFLSVDNDLDFCKPLDIDDDYLIEDIFNNCKFISDIKASGKVDKIKTESTKEEVCESKEVDLNNKTSDDDEVSGDEEGGKIVNICNDNNNTDVTSVGEMFIYIGKMKYFALKKLPEMLTSITTIENLLMNYVCDNDRNNKKKNKRSKKNVLSRTEGNE